MIPNARNLLKNWTKRAIRHPWRWLPFFFFACRERVGRVETGAFHQFSILLPQDTDSVRTAHEASERVGSTDFLVVAIEGRDPERNVKSRCVGVRQRRDMPELEEVSARIELEFFKRNALLYFEAEELARLLEQIRTVLGRARLKAMGLLVLPSGEDPEEKKLEAMLRHSGARAQVPGEFQNAASSSAASGGYFASPDGTIFAVVGRPRSLSVDMSLARQLVRKTEVVIADVLQDFPQPHPKVEVAGGYRNRVAEYDNILDDVKSSFLVSFLLIAAMVVIFFRSLRPVPLIFLPLILGIMLTLGLVRVLIRRKTHVIRLSSVAFCWEGHRFRRASVSPLFL